ncbi:hypothetical protein K1719_005426 [Acacia pycnantha]|nr:hypothetical protein K1719_005426 [Acacia pycnantha]
MPAGNGASSRSSTMAFRRRASTGWRRRLFQLSQEEKRKVSRDARNVIGCYDTDHTKNVQEWKEVFDFSANK